MIRISVTLSIWSERLSADQITCVLGAPPDHAVVKGSDRMPPRPAPRAHGWHISVQGHQDRAHVEESLEIMTARINPIKGKFSHLKEIDADVSVCMIVNITPEEKAKTLPIDYEVSMYININTISLLAEIGASLSLETFSCQT